MFLPLPGKKQRPLNSRRRYVKTIRTLEPFRLLYRLSDFPADCCAQFACDSLFRVNKHFHDCSSLPAPDLQIDEMGTVTLGARRDGIAHFAADHGGSDSFQTKIAQIGLFLVTYEYTKVAGQKQVEYASGAGIAFLCARRMCGFEPNSPNEGYPIIQRAP
jgi:hypothetical protein